MTPATGHVADLVDDYLHDLLPRDRAAHVERHCAGCADCARALDDARRRQGALRALPPAEPSGRLIQATLDRVEGYERRRRRLRARLFWGVGLAAAASVLVLVGLHVHYFNLKPTNYDLLVLGQKQLLSATTASVRIRLVDRTSQMAVPGVPVVVEMRHKDGRTVELATATTDADGAAAPRFTLPDWPDGDYELRVRAATGRREEVLSQSVQLKRSWKLMLGSDKPVYKPGQTIRLRALALRR